MSSFSSYGPSFDFSFVPTLSAVGGDVLSTYLNDTYAVISGTSMATPFVAGGAALLLAAKPKSLTTVRAIKDLLETTSTLIRASDGTGLDSTIRAGAGLINVYNAIHTTTVVSPGVLNVNDYSNFKPK
jgi:subtilisin family serine protease